jgi:hypothetical protein
MNRHPFGFTFNTERASELLEDAREGVLIGTVAGLLTGIAVVGFALMLFTSPAPAAPRDANGNRVTIAVPTAAGITIRVAPSFAEKIVPFIAANVAAGRRFRQIHCLNFAKSHVKNSRHFSGNACDFRPNPVGRLAGQFGLRDGCSFRDCMHIDNGPLLSATYSAHRRRKHRMAHR